MPQKTVDPSARLDEMVKEAVEILDRNYYIGSGNYFSVFTPWFTDYRVSKSHLPDLDAEEKAAIVYYAGQHIINESVKIAILGEALYHAYEVNLTLTTTAREHLDGMADIIHQLGYGWINIAGIVDDQNLETNPDTRGEVLKQRLEEKVREFSNVKIFYTSDGIGYFEPMSTKPSAMEQLEVFANDIVPERIEERSTSLIILLRQGLGDKYNGERGDELEKIIEGSPDLSRYVELKETIDGDITYVSKEGVDKVKSSVSEYRDLQNTVRRAIKRLRFPHIRFPSFGTSSQKVQVEEPTIEIEPSIPDEEDISGYRTLEDAYYDKKYQLVGDFVERRRFGEDRVYGEYLAASAQIRYLLEPLSTNNRINLNHETQNGLWSEFKDVSRDYKALVGKRKGKVNSVIEGDAKIMDGFLLSPVFHRLEEHYQSQFRREIGRFKATFSLQ